LEKQARLAAAAETSTSSPSLNGDNNKVQAKRLKEVEAELADQVRAIQAGVLTETTKAELESCEAERAQLKASMAEGDGSHSKLVTMIPQGGGAIPAHGGERGEAGLPSRCTGQCQGENGPPSVPGRRPGEVRKSGRREGSRSPSTRK